MTYPEAQTLLFRVRAEFPMLHSETTLLPGFDLDNNVANEEVVCLGPAWDLIITAPWTWDQVVAPALRHAGVPPEWYYVGDNDE